MNTKGHRKITYGVIAYPDGSFRCKARINKSGTVEFILWKAGEQGHESDYWHRMGAGWINWFIPIKEWYLHREQLPV